MDVASYSGRLNAEIAENAKERRGMVVKKKVLCPVFSAKLCVLCVLCVENPFFIYMPGISKKGVPPGTPDQ